MTVATYRSYRHAWDPRIGDPVQVRLPNPEVSKRWYPAAYEADGREGQIVEIRPEDCTRKFLVRLENGTKLELSEDSLVTRRATETL